MLQFRISENVRWYALGLGLAGALLLLAILQYRSNRQLRDVLQKQMHSTLQGSLMNVRFGIEQEFWPMVNTFSSPSQTDNFEMYARDFAHWRTTDVHPALVLDFYIAQRNVAQHANSSELRLFRLQLDSSKFEFALWPADFIPLREKLDQMSAAESPLPPWLVEEKVPALIHPVRSSGKPQTQSFVIIQLNLNELAGHILPELAQRYLGSNGHLDYQVALINRNAGSSTVYSSDAGFGAGDYRTSDAQSNVFGPPVSGDGPPSTLFRFDARRSERSPNERPPSERPHDFRDKRPPAEPGQRESRPNGPQTNRGLPGESEPDSFSSAGAPILRPGERETVRRDARPLRIEPIRYAPDDRGWTIIARHRKGSVEAAVAAAYHRNLAVSFGVLVLLAGTIAVIVMTTQRARRLARLQMDFVASVSHELRTPLTGIVSAAQNVADGLVDNKERAMRYGAAILGQAQQLSELIEQILLFSATEKGQHQYQFQWVEIPEVIEASLTSAASLIRSSGVHVEQAVEARLPPVWADFKALTQCLQNLIINAIKYGGENRWTGLRANLAGNEVIVTVEDKGLGISPDDLNKIFDPFYRSPLVAAAQIHGSGLGLAIVKDIAEAMGGRLTVESELGKGSRFSVHLPADKKPVPRENLPESTPVEAAGNR
jgi:signal transduction histidine kinase